MTIQEIKKVPFINHNNDLVSFSLRATAIIYSKDRYLMVLNEGASKYKHPGGHININESLIDGLKRELKEEINYDFEEERLGVNFCDNVNINGNIMINVYFELKVSDNDLQGILSKSILPSKLISLDELDSNNTWESEIQAIKYLRGLR